MSNSRALVIKSIKQGETSSIVSCYLEEIGFKSFLVKGLYGQKKSKNVFFQNCPAIIGT